MTGIVGPRRSPQKSTPAETVAVSITIEGEVVDEYVAAEPIRAPAPTPTAPTPAAPSAEAESHVDPRSEPVAIARIEKRRIVSPFRWSPHIVGVIGGDVDHLRIGRLNLDRTLPTLILGGHRL